MRKHKGRKAKRRVRTGGRVTTLISPQKSSLAARRGYGR